MEIYGSGPRVALLVYAVAVGKLSAGLGQCRSFAEPDSSYHAGEVGFRCCATKTEAQGLLEGMRTHF